MSSSTKKSLISKGIKKPLSVRLSSSFGFLVALTILLFFILSVTIFYISPTFFNFTELKKAYPQLSSLLLYAMLAYCGLFVVRLFSSISLTTDGKAMLTNMVRYYPKGSAKPC